MSDIEKTNQTTFAVKTTEKVEKVREWTLETLDAAIAQYDTDIDKLQEKKDELVALRSKAVEIGVVHPKDVIPEAEEEAVADEE